MCFCVWAWLYEGLRVWLYETLCMRGFLAVLVIKLNSIHAWQVSTTELYTITYSYCFFGLGGALLFLPKHSWTSVCIRSEKSSEKIHPFAFVYNICFEMKWHMFLYALCFIALRESVPIIVQPDDYLHCFLSCPKSVWPNPDIWVHTQTCTYKKQVLRNSVSPNEKNKHPRAVEGGKAAQPHRVSNPFLLVCGDGAQSSEAEHRALT